MFIDARRLKSGLWRLYEVEKTALVSWRGDNFKASVIRDVDGAIVSFPSFDAARQWALDHNYSAPFKP